MQDAAIFVVIEIVSVTDPAGLADYAQRAGALIGQFGGEVLGQGGKPVDEEGMFGPLVLQRWRSEAAFRAWLDSDAYRPLGAIRRTSAIMKASIVPTATGPQARPA